MDMNGPDLENVTLSKVSQTEKDKYMRSLICGILKNGTNELIYKTEPVTDVENELMVTKRERGGYKLD